MVFSVGIRQARAGLKTALAGFGISALVHAIIGLVVVPLLLWQDKLGLPEAQPTVVPLSLAQFQPAPPPTPTVPVVSAPVAKPESPPKPVEKPKPVTKPQPVAQPKLAKKPVEKKLPAATKPKSDSPPKPETPVVKPVVAPSPSPIPAVTTQAVTPVPKPAPVATSAPAIDNVAAEAAYRQKLQHLIGARKQYPRQAERAEVEGIVTVSFTVLPNGTITGARVSQSSGNEWLDKAALQAVNASSGSLPFPAGIHKKQWNFVLKVNFKLDW